MPSLLRYNCFNQASGRTNTTTRKKRRMIMHDCINYCVTRLRNEFNWRDSATRTKLATYVVHNRIRRLGGVAVSWGTPPHASAGAGKGSKVNYRPQINSGGRPKRLARSGDRSWNDSGGRSNDVTRFQIDRSKTSSGGMSSVIGSYQNDLGTRFKDIGRFWTNSGTRSSFISRRQHSSGSDIPSGNSPPTTIVNWTTVTAGRSW